MTEAEHVMHRYYFHNEDGVTQLDDLGAVLPNLDAVRLFAIHESGAMLLDGASSRLWDGTPWRMWVTDRPNGKGAVVCELYFTAGKPAVA